MFVRKFTYDTAIAQRDEARAHAEILHAENVGLKRGNRSLRVGFDTRGDALRRTERDVARLREENVRLRDQLAKFSARGADGRFVKRVEKVA